MDIFKMVQQAKQMQETIKEQQAKMAERSVKVSVDDGKVEAMANGLGQIQSLKIAPELVQEGNVEELERLVLHAVREASEKGRELAAEEMGKVAGPYKDMLSGLGL